MAFSSRNIIRCLLKKRLTKGGGGVTRALCQTLSSWRFRHGILYVVCLKKGLQRGGGHACTVSNIIVMAFSSRNIIRCLLKKRLTKGGGGSRVHCAKHYRHGVFVTEYYTLFA